MKEIILIGRNANKPSDDVDVFSISGEYKLAFKSTRKPVKDGNYIINCVYLENGAVVSCARGTMTIDKSGDIIKITDSATIAIVGEDAERMKKQLRSTLNIAGGQLKKIGVLETDSGKSFDFGWYCEIQDASVYVIDNDPAPEQSPV